MYDEFRASSVRAFMFLWHLEDSLMAKKPTYKELEQGLLRQDSCSWLRRLKAKSSNQQL